MDKISNTLYATALGDGWGRLTEFMTLAQIAKNPVPVPEELIITDDTQMSIYTVQAVNAIMEQGLLAQFNPSDPEWCNHARRVFANYYLLYLEDSDNNELRAPGMTVTSSLETLRWKRELGEFRTGREGARNPRAKGCGAVMRTGWLGLFENVPEEAIFTLAYLSAQVTHGNPVSWLFAGISALIVRDPESYAKDNVFTEFSTWNAVLKWNKWSHQVFGVAPWRRDLELAESRWHGNLWKFYRADKQEPEDMCRYLGAGWTADEAMTVSRGAMAQAMKDEQPGSFEFMRRLVHSSGDTDSIASMGGSYMAQLMDHDYTVYHDRLEPRYREELQAVADILRKWNQT